MVLVLSPNLCRLSLGSLRMVVFFKYIYWWIIELTMSTAITNTQQIETVIIQQIFISRQARANRLLIYGELYQHTSKQDVEKQRSSSLASRNICVDCLAIGRQDNQCRRPKHSLWLNKRYIWNSKTKIVIYRHSNGTEGFIGETRRFPLLFNCRILLN